MSSRSESSPASARQGAIPEEPPERRATCAACRRPLDLCYCEHVTPTQTRTRVVVLQHPREARVPLGTLRMLELSLPEARIGRGVDFDGDPLVEALYQEQPAPFVLYPGPGAQDLSELPREVPITLIAIDGTWSQAKALLRQNPRLAALPRVAFSPGSPSIYRIRRQPAEHCVSTLEALARALDVLEGPEGRFEEALLAPLRALVSDQLRLTRERPSYRTRRTRGPRPTRPPQPDTAAQLAANWEHLVCVQGEANAWPASHPDPGEPELVQWRALRLATGEEFSATIRPRQALGPDTVSYTEVAPEVFLAGESWESFASRWEAFRRPDDVLASWGYFHSGLAEAAGLPPERIDVRIAAARVLGKRSGRVEQCAERLGVTVEAAEPGRCARRLALLATIVREVCPARLGG